MEDKRRQDDDGHARHVRVWKIVRPIAAAWLWITRGFRAVPSDLKPPFLLLSNHNTDLDPVMVGSGFREQFYFVGSEHILRAGLAGRLLRWLQDPIPRQKSGSGAGTALTVLRRLRKGYGVAIFPEGNRSWDGVTGPIYPSTAKLARAAGVPLVTYRLEGGYFTSPRWSGNSVRRGRSRGRVIRVYSPEELKAMTEDEVLEHIRSDLFEDAVARQRKDPIRFRGSRPAEHMETLFFLCPGCGRQHTLSSRGDTLRCWKCGFEARFLPTGFLTGSHLPADNVRDWVRIQKEEIRRLCEEAGDRPIFTDTEMSVSLIRTAKSEKTLGRGEMKLFRDRLELPGATLPVENITGMSVRGAQNLYISTAKRTYLIRSNFSRCTVKYLTACSFLNDGAEYGI